MLHRKLATAVLALGILLPAWAHAQRFEFPEMPQMPPMDLGAIMELQTTGTSSRTISMTMENGVRKINAAEDDLKAYIEEQRDGSVLVKVTRHYTSADLDKLMNEQPELYMHLKSIPETTGDAEVEVSVWLTKTFEAPSARELEEKHPEVFEVYQRFTSGTDEDLGRMRFRGFAAPRSLELDIDPGSIRIHPAPDSASEAQSGNSSSSSSSSESNSDSDEQSSSDSDFDIDR